MHQRGTLSLKGLRGKYYLHMVDWLIVKFPEDNMTAKMDHNLSQLYKNYPVVKMKYHTAHGTDLRRSNRNSNIHSWCPFVGYFNRKRHYWPGCGAAERPKLEYLSGKIYLDGSFIAVQHTRIPAPWEIVFLPFVVATRPGILNINSTGPERPTCLPAFNPFAFLL